MKDPAVLFYFQDFLVGTEFMTDEEVGKYIRILCHQADKGPLSIQKIQSICHGIEIPAAILEKLRVDDQGNYYQERMRSEREKRANYIENQRERAQKRWSKEESHGNAAASATAMPFILENENKDLNKVIDIKINVPFEKFWDAYDKKIDRGKCEKKWIRLTDDERSACMKGLPAYVLATPIKKFRRDPETYLNNKSWENEIVTPSQKFASQPERPIFY